MRGSEGTLFIDYLSVVLCIILLTIGVWYGMVWYGMVWYGMVWYGMVWFYTNISLVIGEYI